jgi:glycosyltransferase involved in cell wall biosynthesis
VLAAPPENLASKIIAGANAGVAVPAGDTQAFGNAVASLLDDTTDRDLRARNGRAYAERTFDIAAIGGRFEKIIRAAKA